MHYKTFYRLSLLLPVLMPVLFYLLSLRVGADKFTNLLLSSLVVGGAQYLVFAAAMFYLIGRLASLKKVKVLFWCSPLIYIVFGAAGWHIAFYVWEYSRPMYKLSLDDALGPFLFFAIFGSLFGYVYCLVIEFVFQMFKMNEWVSINKEE